MATKQRPKTTGNRVVAKFTAEMVGKMTPDTLDEFERAVWSRMDCSDRSNLFLMHDIAISDMLMELDLSDAVEVEKMLLARLEEDDRNTILANRTRHIAEVIAEWVANMAPDNTEEVTAMISTLLEQQERDEKDLTLDRKRKHANRSR